MSKRAPTKRRLVQPSFADFDPDPPPPAPDDPPEVAVPTVPPPLLPEDLRHLSDDEIQGSAVAGPSNAPQGPQLPYRMQSRFGQALLLIPNLQEVLDREQEESLIQHETLNLTVLKNLKRMITRWEDYCHSRSIDKPLWYRPETHYNYSRSFLQLLIKVTKGTKAKGLVSYGTLTGWCTTLIRMISRHCVDAAGERQGSSLLRSGLQPSDEGLFGLLVRHCKFLFRQHNLDREIPEGVFWGRFEVQLIIETLFGASSLSMELAVQYALTLAIATVTALRPGGLGYSHREWCGLGGEDSKFLQNKDLRIQRDLERGRGAFILHLKVRHMKAQNDDQSVKYPVYNLRSHTKPQNAIFDPVNYLIPLLYHRGELSDYRDKPYSEVLDGKELYLAIENPELPLFRAAKRGGAGVDGVRAASASSINRRIVEAAVKANLRSPGGHKVGSVTDIRKKRGWEFADMFGNPAASELLGHALAKTVQQVHYDVGVGAWDLVGIFLGEREDGDRTAHSTALALNLFRQPALRTLVALRMRGDLETQADDQDEDTDGAEQSAATGSKRKAPASKPKVEPGKSQRYRPIDDGEDCKIRDQVAAMQDVSSAKKLADDAWQRLTHTTALELVRGNKWKYLLTLEGDEDLPEGWDPKLLESGWGREAERKRRAELYHAANENYLKLHKKRLRIARREYLDAQSRKLENLKERGNVEYMEDAVQAQEAPSNLLYQVAPHLIPSHEDDKLEDDDEEASSDAEATFFFSAAPPPEKSPLYDIINSQIYGDPNARDAPPEPRPSPPPATTTGASTLGAPPPVKPKGKSKPKSKPLAKSGKDKGKGKGKGKGKDSKGKGKAVPPAASPDPAASTDNAPGDEDEEEHDDRFDIDSPFQVAEAGDEFDESVETAFDTRRSKELEELMKTHTGEDFRVAWQLNLVALLKTDEALVTQRCPKCPESEMTYTRAKLTRHNERVHLVLDALFSGISFEEFARDTEVSNFKCPLCRKAKKYSSASYLLRHIRHQCKKGLLHKVERKPKRRKNNLGESTSTQQTSSTLPSTSRARPPLADFRRGNTPNTSAQSAAHLTSTRLATDGEEPVFLAGPSARPRRTARKVTPIIEADEDGGKADDEDYVDDGGDDEEDFDEDIDEEIEDY